MERVLPHPMVMANPTSTRLPLLFSYRDTLFGNGFLVEVRVLNGRALCVQESEGYWMYGVNPGGMSASGPDLQGAHLAFRKAFSDILINLALEVESFDAFRAAVEAFFNETNDGFEPEWRAAVDAVRQNNLSVAGLERAPANSPRQVMVTIKTVPRAEDNVSVSDALLAA